MSLENEEVLNLSLSYVGLQENKKRRYASYEQLQWCKLQFAEVEALKFPRSRSERTILTENQ